MSSDTNLVNPEGHLVPECVGIIVPDLKLIIYIYIYIQYIYIYILGLHPNYRSCRNDNCHTLKLG